MEDVIGSLFELSISEKDNNFKRKKITIYNVIEIIAPFMNDLGASSLFDSCKNFSEYRKKYKHWRLNEMWSIRYFLHHPRSYYCILSNMINPKKQLSLTLPLGYIYRENNFDNIHTIYLLRQGNQKIENKDFYPNCRIIYLQKQYNLNIDYLLHKGYDNSDIIKLQAYEKEFNKLRESETNICYLLSELTRVLGPSHYGFIYDVSKYRYEVHPFELELKNTYGITIRNPFDIYPKTIDDKILLYLKTLDDKIWSRYKFIPSISKND
jgi:hypothetical protein